ncbi:hypothetical protein SEA_CLOWN_39 [Gordonia phage Clown]|uniref:Minor tail protein n=1 Tax=Gordonia phage Clown TaxID=2759393 RepID=A0A7L7SPF4_9CAUD|nr:hypothetical protein KNV25_gp39 [Gordonia phage Clown]QOC56037.1 hypothetical protein SEA_CLOWN_39 [Gordonia phage Clown]
MAITYTLNDGFGTPGKKIKLSWRPATIRTVDGQLVVSGEAKVVPSTVGVLTSIPNVAPGMWRISNFFGGPIFIDVPEAGGDVTALIQAAIGVPQNAPVTTLLDAAKVAAEAAVDDLDIVTTVAGKYTKPAGGIPLTDLKKADLDGTYVRFTNQNGDPLPPGTVVEIRVNTTTSEIDDIIVAEGA